MKHLTFFNFVLTTALVLDVQAGTPTSMTGEQAKTATAFAIDAAAESAERISQMHVESAMLATVLTYGSEQGEAMPMYPTKDNVEKAVAAKLAYWKAVSAALVVEWRQIGESTQRIETPPDKLLHAAMRLGEISRLSLAANFIVADAEMDTVLVKSIGAQRTESNQELLNRKARLFKTLHGLRKTENGETAHHEFFRTTSTALDVLNLLPGPVTQYSPSQFPDSVKLSRRPGPVTHYVPSQFSDVASDLKIEQLKLEPVSSVIRRMGR